ncbi:MAG: hypothetical protein SVS15_08830 [Thermodesulfobacteriota bacterium]|nr:hypothetical protein [Thermodesulfobacteriota bacterium]
MFDTPAKHAREHIARAKVALGKGDIQKSVVSLIEAVKMMSSGKIFGREKFEVEVHFQECLKEFNRHEDIKKFFTSQNVHKTPYVTYQRGRERDVLQFMTETLAGMQAGQKKSEQEAEGRKDQKKKDMLDRGQELLDSKEFPKAKSVMRKVAEAYGKEPGVLTDIGGRLLKAGLFFEAGEFLEEAIAKNPKDSHAFAFAVQAYKNAREFAKMETLYKAALKQFGAHPKTLQNMAKMYLDWRKYDKAYDFAKQAFDGDNSLSEAKEIMDTCGKRIFSR